MYILNVVNLLVLSREWMGMGVAGMIINSDEMDHSRKFPAFRTSK
jgi:hypothetical protein